MANVDITSRSKEIRYPAAWVLERFDKKEPSHEPGVTSPLRGVGEDPE